MAIQSLPNFLATTGELTPAQRSRLVEQASLLLNELYVHLPLKRAMHAIDPGQQLRNLSARAAQLSERAFHDELIDIFTDLRDLHTNYLLPAPFAGQIAFLPFLVEEYYDRSGTPHFIVTKMLAGFTDDTFVVGSEITFWSGTPMARAVDLNAERQAGSNDDARHARGLEAMTLRDMTQSSPPAEWWVTISFTTPTGAGKEIRLDWQVFAPDPSPNAVDPDDGGRASARVLGYDAVTERRRRAKKVMFNPPAMKAEATATRRRATASADATSSTMPDVFAFRDVATSSGVFGYLRIWTFMVDDAEAFLVELVRILALLPSNGLIIDVRGNGGGNLLAAEGALQLFTPHRISPTLLSLIATEVTTALCASDRAAAVDLQGWRDSLIQASLTGSVYSQSLPIVAEADFNQIGQCYQGPVVLITDALCYSATDMFAAGFRDNDLGPILGTAANTGAGGANVWTHELFRSLFGDSFGFRALPRQSAFRVAFRRTTRQGSAAGTPIEDLGIVPDAVHRLTKRDILQGNQDLIAAAARSLKRLPLRKLEVAVDRVAGGRLALTVSMHGIDRVDIACDGRPITSIDGVDGVKRVRVTPPGRAQQLELSGFSRGRLVVRRSQSLR